LSDFNGSFHQADLLTYSPVVGHICREAALVDALNIQCFLDKEGIVDRGQVQSELWNLVGVNFSQLDADCLAKTGYVIIIYLR
jgi:hypothetical protein